jgi:hypothetical protein
VAVFHYRRKARKGTGGSRTHSRDALSPCVSTLPGLKCPSHDSREVPLLETEGTVIVRPAAAVIPAPIAYIKVVAVKKLVVEPWDGWTGPPHRVHWLRLSFPSGEPHALRWACWGTRTFTLNKSGRSTRAFA